MRTKNRIAKNWQTKGIGLTMLITTCICLSLLLRSILFYIVTKHYHPSTQCRIGLISKVIGIVISIVNPMPLILSLFSQSYSHIFSQKSFCACHIMKLLIIHPHLDTAATQAKFVTTLVVTSLISQHHSCTTLADKLAYWKWVLSIKISDPQCSMRFIVS